MRQNENKNNNDPNCNENCMNGGTCFQNQCKCKPGFSGFNCEIRM